MTDINQEFNELFLSLKADQQSDILSLMKTWFKQNQVEPLQKSSDVLFNPIVQNPTLSKEWHCLTALKEVVEKHYEPAVELAYIAFHQDLDSISSAKSRAAVKQMYLLEAAYELKRILEADPESDLLDEQVLKTLQSLLSKEE